MALHEREITAPVDIAGPAGLPRAATLPGTLGEGPARSRTRTVQLEFTHHDDATHLRASGPRVCLEAEAHRPPGRESLGVVVPWSQQFYQYTVQDLAVRPPERSGRSVCPMSCRAAGPGPRWTTDAGGGTGTCAGTGPPDPEPWTDRLSASRSGASGPTGLAARRTPARGGSSVQDQRRAGVDL